MAPISQPLQRMLPAISNSRSAHLYFSICPEDKPRRAMSDLPGSFADVVRRKGEAIELGDLVDKFRMPEPLARWYYAEAAFFRELRDLRDGIAHSGRRLPAIFETECGFSIMPAEPPWDRFAEWPEEKRWRGFGSLRSIFAGFIDHVLHATARFATTLKTFLQPPPALGESSLCLFLRSPFGQHLVGLDVMRKQPWEGRDVQIAPTEMVQSRLSQ